MKINIFRRVNASGQPGVVWLNGFRSSMTGDKASAVAAWCEATDRDCVRFDYRGHGDDAENFPNHVVSDWLADASEAFERHARGPQIVVGSSMGGWLAVLMALAGIGQSGAKAWLQGLVLIAPAIDMTQRLIEAHLSDTARQMLAADGVWMRPSRYGDGDYPITRRLLKDGRRHSIGTRILPIGCPVHILHGARDPDVPLSVSRDLCGNLAASDVRLTVIPDGDHRLSRPQDIEILLQAIGDMSG